MYNKGSVWVLIVFLLVFLTVSVVLNKSAQAEEPFVSFQAGEALANYWSIVLSGGNITGDNYIDSVLQTPDGGYMAAGTTATLGPGWNDAIIIKLNRAGAIVWQKAYGEDLSEEGGHALIATSDGNYIAGGYKANQVWLFKIDGDGNIIWQKVFPGDGTHRVNSLQETSDGGLVVSVGVNEISVIKLNSIGTIEWQKIYGGNYLDYARIEETADGGFILFGRTDSVGSSTKGWVIKLNPDGSIAWQKTYGDDTADYRISSGVETSTGGFIVAGSIYDWNTSHSMLWLVSLNSDGSIAWQRTLDNDPLNGSATEVKQTADGGIIVIGTTSSSSDSSMGWLVKFNADGTVAWQKAFQGSDQWTSFHTISLTDDGGFLIGGTMDSSYSFTGSFWLLRTDAYGNIYNCNSIVETTAVLGQVTAPVQDSTFSATNTSLSSEDTFITPFDTAAQLNVLCSVAVKDVLESDWINRYVTEYPDSYANAIQATGDGGAILLVSSYPEYTDNSNVSIIKLNSIGEISWKRTFDGADEDMPQEVIQTFDGTYVALIGTESFTEEVWIIKLDATGNTLWQKTYSNGFAKTMKETSNGGYILAGNAYSIGGGDIWVMKLDTDGQIVWQKTYGGDQIETALDIQELDSGGYIVSGYTQSFGEGDNDAWILKLNMDGSLAWQKTYGGSEADYARAIQSTSDGGFIFVGSTKSFGAGLTDAWVVKLESTGNIVWQKAIGLSYTDLFREILQTVDGQYLLVGYSTVVNTSAYSNGWVLKLDSDGERVWERAYDGGGYEHLEVLSQADDGTIFTAGDSWSPLTGSESAWALKMDSTGEICDCLAIKDISTTITNSTTISQNTFVVPQDHDSAVTEISVPSVDFSMGIGAVCLVLPDGTYPTLTPSPTITPTIIPSNTPTITPSLTLTVTPTPTTSPPNPSPSPTVTPVASEEPLRSFLPIIQQP